MVFGRDRAYGLVIARTEYAIDRDGNVREEGTMAKGHSLAIGLNLVDPKHYGGWSGPLSACEADAADMVQVASAQGFTTKKLLTKDATRKAVLAGLADAAAALQDGDIFFLSYSGHGGQIPDRNGDEVDGADETWCLYDGQLVDDELYKALGAFKQGVRIIVLSDSCHSGTVTKAPIVEEDARRERPRYRAMPPAIALRTYRDNKEMYDPILTSEDLRAAEQRVRASVILISGCQDSQLSSDGTFNGLFTGTLLRVWNNAGFKKSYRDFWRAIVRRMPADQTPNYYRVGKADSDFEHQRPFTV
jgi:hypothetical protein